MEGLILSNLIQEAIATGLFLTIIILLLLIWWPLVTLTEIFIFDILPKKSL